MSDVKALLERASRHIADDPGAFAHLERVRSRRAVGRRITAGAVALVVAIAGIAGAFLALDERPAPRAPISPITPFNGVWPETALSDALAVQKANDEPWRFDAESTATRFVEDVLGWSEYDILDRSVVSRSATFSVDRCATNGTCDGGEDLTIYLQRLVSADGVWSVTRVQSPNIRVDAIPDLPLPFSRSIRSHVDAASGTTVSVGGAYRSRQCQGSLHGRPLTHSAYEIVQRNSFEGCGQNVTGYLYVAVAEGRADGDVSDPLRTPAGPLVDLSVTPVTFDATGPFGQTPQWVLNGTWRAADGQSLLRTTEISGRNYHFEMRQYCYNSLVTMLYVTSGLLDQTPRHGLEQYMRDPRQSMSVAMRGSYDASARLPRAARDTGIHHQGWRIYSVPGPPDNEIYLVGPPNEAGTRPVELWPRVNGIYGC